MAVFGIGGVGGYTVEALARSGVGALDLIDDDRVCLTNVNRQILATRETVGKFKVDVAEARVHAINPNCTGHNVQDVFPARRAKISSTFRSMTTSWTPSTPFPASWGSS